MTVSSIRSRLAAYAEWPLPFCVLAVGILGLADHSRLTRNLTPIDIHILFGLSLWAFVLLRFHRRMRLIARPAAVDIRTISRHLSRMVYLMLGLAVVFKELIGGDSENLRDYLLYALGALMLIRLVALLYWSAAQRRSARAAAEAQLPRVRS
jgi:cytochrome b561